MTTVLDSTHPEQVDAFAGAIALDHGPRAIDTINEVDDRLEVVFKDGRVVEACTNEMKAFVAHAYVHGHRIAVATDPEGVALTRVVIHRDRPDPPLDSLTDRVPRMAATPRAHRMSDGSDVGKSSGLSAGAGGGLPPGRIEPLPNAFGDLPSVLEHIATLLLIASFIQARQSGPSPDWHSVSPNIQETMRHAARSAVRRLDGYQRTRAILATDRQFKNVPVDRVVEAYEDALLQVGE